MMYSKRIKSLCPVAAVAMVILLATASTNAALVSEFNFDADSVGGSTVSDGGPGNNDGFLVGNAEIISVAGRGNVLKLDGSNDFSDHGDSASLDIAGPLTLMAWINRSGDSPSGSTGTIIGKEQASSTGYTLEVRDNNDSVRMIGFGLSPVSLDNVGTITDDVWTHVAGTWDGSTYSIYLDGVLAGSVAGSGSILLGNDPLRLGQSAASGATNNGFFGLIDDARIYNNALSAAEIFNIANPTVPEPTTAALAMLGLGGLVMRRRRAA